MAAFRELPRGFAPGEPAADDVNQFRGGRVNVLKLIKVIGGDIRSNNRDRSNRRIEA